MEFPYVSALTFITAIIVVLAVSVSSDDGLHLCDSSPQNQTVMLNVSDDEEKILPLCVVVDALREEAVFNGTRIVRGQWRNNMKWDFVYNVDTKRFNVTVNLKRGILHPAGRFNITLYSKNNNSSSLDYTFLLLKGCPRHCKGDTYQNVTVKANENKTFSLCVVAETVNEEASLNGTRFIRGTGRNGTCWDFAPNKDKRSYTVTVTLDHIQIHHAGAFNITIRSKRNLNCRLDFTYFLHVEVSESEDVSSSSSTAIWGVFGILTASIVSVILVLCYFLCKYMNKVVSRFRPLAKRNRRLNTELGDGENDVQLCNLNAADTDAGRYISKEGLVYVTVAHSLNSVSPRDAGRYISKEGLVYVTVAHSLNSVSPRVIHGAYNKVQYVTLDKKLSGKFDLNDERGQKALEKIEKRSKRS